MSTKKKSGGSSQRTLHLIGVFKLVKASFLYALAAGAFHSIREGEGGAAETLKDLARAFRVDPHGGYLDKLLAKVTGATPEQLKVLAVGTLVYALLFTVEGVGLLLSRVWAEWLTVIATGSLIPLEIGMIAHKASPTHVATLVVNVLVVVYLLVHRLSASMGATSRPEPLSPQVAAMRRRQIRASQV